MRSYRGLCEMGLPSKTSAKKLEPALHAQPCSNTVIDVRRDSIASEAVEHTRMQKKQTATLRSCKEHARLIFEYASWAFLREHSSAIPNAKPNVNCYHQTQF